MDKYWLILFSLPLRIVFLEKLLVRGKSLSSSSINSKDEGTVRPCTFWRWCALFKVPQLGHLDFWIFTNLMKDLGSNGQGEIGSDFNFLVTVKWKSLWFHLDNDASSWERANSWRLKWIRRFTILLSVERQRPKNLLKQHFKLLSNLLILVQVLWAIRGREKLIKGWIKVFQRLIL